MNFGGWSVPRIHILSQNVQAHSLRACGSSFGLGMRHVPLPGFEWGWKGFSPHSLHSTRGHRRLQRALPLWRNWPGRWTRCGAGAAGAGAAGGAGADAARSCGRRPVVEGATENPIVRRIPTVDLLGCTEQLCLTKDSALQNQVNHCSMVLVV